MTFACGICNSAGDQNKEWNGKTQVSLKPQKKGTLLKFKMDTLLMTILWVVPLPRMQSSPPG